MKHHEHHHHHAEKFKGDFPLDPTGLPEVRASEVVEVADGGTFALRIAPAMKRMAKTALRMLAYNGSIPGPTLRVREGSEITVDITNEGDLEGTVHWHGLRLDNRSDGTHLTQDPIPVGGHFQCRVQFPDPGVYWYHPHIREDYGQELGLYGNIIVDSKDPDYWAPVHREIPLTLDDILIEDGRVAPFGRGETTYVAMGRFGNVLLVNGDECLQLKVRRGEVVRFYMTNTANTRIFNMFAKNARMKLVGGDSGRCEHERFVEEVMLAPSERVVVDVMFDTPGTATLQQDTPQRVEELVRVTVSEERAEPSLEKSFATLRTAPELVAERERIARWLAAEPDKTIAFISEMDMPAVEGAVEYYCPMHADVVRDKEGRCPKCMMKLVPRAAGVEYYCPMHADVVRDKEGRCPKCFMKLIPRAATHGHGDAKGHEHGAGHDAGHGHDAGGHEGGHAMPSAIEWEDDMVELNRTTTPENMRWKIVDRSTGAENHAIDWSFKIGDQVLIRLVNELQSDHPMHHPFHVHGAGRFLILRRDGVVEPSLVWKDTVLVRAGETVDILLDVTHAGIWMAHCHIAEHHESGMMFTFRVEA